jgi:hypothetical protein
MEQTQQTNQQIFTTVKQAYIKALNDKDILINWGKPHLESLYISKIGYLQIDKLQIQLRIKALKRKIELVVACINKEEPVDLINIELQIATELANAEKTILQAAADLDNATFLLSHLATPSHGKELKDLYKQLAKQLHPDVNTNLTDKQKELWHIVQQAYNNGDLEKLRAIPIVYQNELKNAEDAFLQLSEEELLLKIKVLQEGIHVLEREMLAIKQEFPFCMQDEILDDEWIANQKQDLQKELQELTILEQDINQQYLHLIKCI